MSSVPPAPPVSAGLPPLPWEDRQRLGFGNALIETIKLFFTSPKEAFERAREKGDFVSPLIYAIILSWVGAIVGLIWRAIIPLGGAGFMMPAGAHLPFSAAGLGCGMLIIYAIIAPVAILIGLFVCSAILHFCLLIVGGLAHSTSGFEGTFRSLSYSSLSNLANVIPVVGWLIAILWSLYLNVTGLVRMHRTTAGRAILAILIPLVVCCGLLILMAGAIAALFVSAHHGGSV